MEETPHGRKRSTDGKGEKKLTEDWNEIEVKDIKKRVQDNKLRK